VLGVEAETADILPLVHDLKSPLLDGNGIKLACLNSLYPRERGLG
jgi:hypothetical protein